MACLGLITAVAGARQAPHREAPRAATGHQRSSTAGAAATAGFPVPAVVGMRIALETGEGRTAAPVGAAMGGAVVAVVALVAALVFGASLGSLVHHPRLYGWAWDATVIDNSGYGNVNAAKAHELLDSEPAVTAWSGVYFGSVEVDGHNVPSMGVEPGAAVFPPLRSGHEVKGPDEIVLGARTLSDLHKRVGDTVVVGRGERAGPMRVVGSAVLPTIGIGHGAYTSLGTGAALPSNKLPGISRNASSGREGPNAIFIRFRPGADRAAALERIAAKVDAIGDQPGNAVLLPVQRPAEIVNSSHMGATPAVLAGGMALAVLTSLGLGLASGVRRRRRDLALLKALGFTRGQLSATVTWQAVITVLVGLAVGVPVGVALGRWLWVGFARQLSVLASPSLPVALLGGLAGGLVVVAILAAAPPARLAGRTRVATILRSE
ncbi:MAG: ABC transporter permease [Acidimicrobiales bacterium]